MSDRRREIRRIALIGGAVLVLCFVVSSPDEPGFWIYIVLGAILFGPYFEKWELAWLWAKLVLIGVGAPLLFASAASSPDRAAFWVVFGAVVLVALPTTLVSIHFLNQARAPRIWDD